MRKQETIKLKNINDGVVKPFKFQHAEQLLNLEKKIGVQNFIINDPGFVFENGTIAKRSNSEDKEANKRSSVKKSEV